MGALTSYLQSEFIRQCPEGWTCTHEVRVLTPDLEQLLGYSPRADVLLERQDGTRRLWIEFEVSRADPVANHAKFATTHLFKPQLQGDSFVAMISPHIDRGRRNLAANTITLMRHIGMSAFQTVLLPSLLPEQVKELNHLPLSVLADKRLSICDEIERALSVSEPVTLASNRRIHLVGDILEVILNLRQWNQELSLPQGRSIWKRRTVTYFVFDPQSGDFAPSKFCAYVGVPTVSASAANESLRSVMTVGLYSQLDETDSRFDGRRAWTHLNRSLAMSVLAAQDSSGVRPSFDKWLNRFSDSISVHPSGPVFLIPPGWFK